MPVRALPGKVTLKPRAPQQLLDPRDFEINQIVRRWSPRVTEKGNATVLAFKLIPSDPDFPFELAGLHVSLSVPSSYPNNASPSIHIDNQEMERGYQINVEKGFDELVTKQPAKTLLALMNELDKNLENLLVSQKAKTIKLIANAPKTISQHPQLPPQTTTTQPSSVPAVIPSKTPYTLQEVQHAHAKRETDIRQIEARMGRQPLYSSFANGNQLNIPLQVPKAGRLPLSLQAVKDARLIVPQLYPLESCTIRLREGSTEAGRVECAFEEYAKEHPELTLMAHINHLVQNLHLMAQEDIIEAIPPMASRMNEPEHRMEVSLDLPTDQPRLLDEDRPHIQMISRPLEWDMQAPESDEDDSDFSGSELSDSEMEEEVGGAQLDSTERGSTTGPERGILLSFPMLELYNIELMQVSSLCLTIKCDRCKTMMDVMAIKPVTTEGGISRTVESCKKCSSSLSIVYRSEPVHINSIRAGHLDLEGCTVVDMLPSTFQPTCSECSTTFSKPGVVSVRGETSMIICRQCHKKMVFKLPQITFLRVSSAERPNRPLPRKKPKENLGIVAGNELPKKGRCQHYAKSYRWFRFSCCQKVSRNNPYIMT